MVLPSARHARATSRMNAGVATAIGKLPGPVLDLVALGRRSRGSVGRSGGSRIRMLGPRERAVADLLDIPLRCAGDLSRQVRVTLDELRRLAGGDAKHVVKDQD